MYQDDSHSVENIDFVVEKQAICRCTIALLIVAFIYYSWCKGW